MKRAFSLKFATVRLALLLAAIAVTAPCGVSWAQEKVVELSTSELRAQALTALAAGNRAEAIESADAMIRQNNADARAMRLAADIYLRAGEIEFAIQLFDRYVEMEPEEMPQLWQRGIALYFNGQYAKAAKQFEAHREVNPFDVENAAWHYLCVAKASSPAEAKKQLLPAPNDPRIPMAEILKMYANGNMDAVNERVNSLAVESPERAEASFYADLYVGMYADANGDMVEARQYIDRAAKDAPRHYMGDVARVYAETLEKRAAAKK